MITAQIIERDYLTAQQIAKDWNISPETVRRWIRKGYADKSLVEVYSGRYWVHKDEVERWRAAFAGRPLVSGFPVPFAKA